MRHIILIFISTLTILFTNCSSGQVDKDTNEIDLSDYYNKYDVTGSFILYNLNGDTTLRFHRQQLEQAFTPASTFKICNSLIGIESGVIPDQNYTISWDSVQRQNPSWNQDTDLKTAFQNSTVWYYQELAERIGEDTMKYWLDKLHYGNADISGGITEFWLSGGLRITPKQQINFLKNLALNNLPLSQRTMDIVKGIMVIETATNYTLYGKTGWGFQDNEDIGWFVGFIETNGGTYVFANCVQTKDPNNTRFAESRRDIVYAILEQETTILKSE